MNSIPPAVIGPFEAIQYVGTPLTLVAFIVAVMAWVYRARLAERRKLIETAPERERADLLTATIRDFSTVPLENLTKQQRYQLALKLIQERQARFRLLALSGVAVAIALAVFLAVGASSPGGLDLAVRLHGPGGPQDVITAGTVILDAGGLRLRGEVGPDGQARFENLARDTFEHGLSLTATAPGMEPEAETRLDALPPGGAIAVAMRPRSTVVHGIVLDGPVSRRPLAGIIVNFAAGAAIDTTDGLGNFHATLVRPPGSRVALQLVQDGRVGFDDAVTLSTDQTLVLYYGPGGER